MNGRIGGDDVRRGRWDKARQFAAAASLLYDEQSETSEVGGTALEELIPPVDATGGAGRTRAQLEVRGPAGVTAGVVLGSTSRSASRTD